MDNYLLTARIKAEAKRLGFFACGISKATFLDQEASHLSEWLRANRQGDMHYMEQHFDKRLDPRLLVEGAQSIVSLAYNYYTPKRQHPHAPKLSKYAFGEDYHHVIKKKLNELMKRCAVGGRAFVDSAPVMDKAWAQRGGLGWIGKNSNLINQQQGSFFFLATLVLDVPLRYDAPVDNRCGTCTRCIEACPTQAIVAPHVVDGSRCIAYFTIEFKKELPQAMQGKFNNWAFGCDTCQDVCPWNRFAIPHQEPAFEPQSDWLHLNEPDWIAMTEDVFEKLFSKSALKRAKYAGLQRNIAFLQQG